MINILTPLFLAVIFVLFVELSYRLSARGKLLGYYITGKKKYKILLDTDEKFINGYTYNGLFTKAIVLSGKLCPEVLAHEEAHTHQPNPIYLAVLPYILLIHYNIYVSVALMVITYKLLVLYFERRADIYAYERYGIKYKAKTGRPQNRWQRLKAWLTDNHAPDWIRTREEYYQKNVWLLRLFWQDVTH